MNQVIRVLHVITSLDVGGAEMMLYRLLSFGDPRRFSHAVIVLKQSGAVGRQIANLPVPVHELKITGAASIVPAMRSSSAVLRDFRPHILQTWLHHADLFGTLLKLRAGQSTALVWNLRCSILNSAEVPRRNLLLVRLLGVASFLPRVVIANSEAGRRAHMSAWYRPRRWAIIPNGFDLETFAPNETARRHIRSQWQVDDDCPVIGIVGRYHKMKGQLLFLQAASRFIRECGRVKFVMVGADVDAANRELSQSIRSMGLSDHVRLEGPRNDIAEVMTAFDLLTCASTSEGFPNVIGEAMACGVPCVTTDVGDSRVIVGDTGFVIPADDPEDLCRNWQKFFSLSPPERKDLARRTRERIAANYEIRYVVSKYQDLYEEIAG